MRWNAASRPTDCSALGAGAAVLLALRFLLAFATLTSCLFLAPWAHEFFEGFVRRAEQPRRLLPVQAERLQELRLGDEPFVPKVRLREADERQRSTNHGLPVPVAFAFRHFDPPCRSGLTQTSSARRIITARA